MPRDESPSSRVAARYAEMFVEVFGRIAADPSDSVVVDGTGGPQQSASGVPFRGVNAVVTALAAAARGYGVPVWLTRTMKDDLGLMVRAGERSVPIVHYDFYWEDLRTGRRDPSMDDAGYAALPKEEREHWARRCYMRSYPEFNICQTDFGERYPEQWEALCRRFIGSVPEGGPSGCPALDAVASSGEGWLCPVVPSPGSPVFSYDEERDVIGMADRSVLRDPGRWYGDMLYAMARSTGSEGRLDRGLGSPLLAEAAREELVSELAGATLATLAGVQSCLQDRNLVHLKSWTEAMGGDPMVIYTALSDAVRASELAADTLGLARGRGFDLQALMDGVEEARRAREEARERRERRAAEVGAGHRRGWSPVKAAKPGGKGRGAGH